MAPATHASWPYWNIDHRRQFSNLKDGIHVPGYTGYMPQRKYLYGDRFASVNEKLLPSQIIRKPLPPIPPKPKSGIKEPAPDDGMHKYLPNMVPGYTGYIPHRLYNYGESYGDDCVTCIKQFTKDKMVTDSKFQQVQGHVAQSIHLKPIADDAHVLDKINQFTSTGNTSNTKDKRRITEPPKIGWTGFVPRKNNTDFSLGVRESAANEAALKTFFMEQDRQKDLVSKPIDITETIDSSPSWVTERKRIYTPGGLKPKFTGFIPHRRFVYGKTYGNMTREMSVCSHRRDTYGDHNSNRRF